MVEIMMIKGDTQEAKEKADKNPKPDVKTAPFKRKTPNVSR